MKLFIHIGMSKAGSSAIQQALIQNDIALREQQILFARAGRNGESHYGLLDALNNGSGKRTIEDILREGELAKAETIVVSSEGFWLLKQEMVQKLREITSSIDTEVILYLRKPESYLPSSYRQGVKRTVRKQSITAYLNGLGERMNYPLLLERWSSLFPLHVRVYESQRTCLEQSFFQVIGASGIKPESTLVNVTPEDGVLKVILAGNRVLPHWMMRRIAPVLLKRAGLFHFFGPIDNTDFIAFGKNAKHQWDLDILARFLSQQDIKTLMSD